MELNYVYAGNFPLAGTFTDYEADKQMALITHCVSNVRKVPVDKKDYPKPTKFYSIDGGRGK